MSRLCRSRQGKPYYSLTSCSHVFEKSLIEKHLAATGQCPVTGVTLDTQDLVALKVAKASAPKPLVANNIPGILNLLQSEWDALMLEVFSLRQNLDSTRKELAHALYQHDAACHVIARLIKEKGELQRKHEESEIRVNDLIDRLQN